MKIDFPMDGVEPGLRTVMERSEPLVVVLCVRDRDGKIHSIAQMMPEVTSKVTESTYALGKIAGTATRLVHDLLRSLEASDIGPDVIAAAKEMFALGALLAAEKSPIHSEIRLRERGQQDPTH